MLETLGAANWSSKFVFFSYSPFDFFSPDDVNDFLFYFASPCHPIFFWFDSDLYAWPNSCWRLEIWSVHFLCRNSYDLHFLLLPPKTVSSFPVCCLFSSLDSAQRSDEGKTDSALFFFTWTRFDLGRHSSFSPTFLAISLPYAFSFSYRIPSNHSYCQSIARLISRLVFDVLGSFPSYRDHRSKQWLCVSF